VPYHGNVRVGGPADLRDLADLQITKIAVGPMDNNAYFLRSPQTGETLLIDAAAEPDRLLGLAEEGIDRVVTTHRHRDHWGALAAVVSATSARCGAHPQDAPELPVEVDDLLEDGASIAVGNARLEVIHLVGHTPGSIALLYDDPRERAHLFTGDSLFPGGPGKTTNPTDFTSLMDDLEDKVFGRLPDETWVYPGHGKDTTLGTERPHLDQWRARGW
jgi:glyoxylase-like metal-dependent hydrolase (beta-lactamase superfamily II)